MHDQLHATGCQSGDVPAGPESSCFSSADTVQSFRKTMIKDNWLWQERKISSFLFYEDCGEMDEDTRDIYRTGMAAFEGIVPEYHIVLRDKPAMA